MSDHWGTPREPEILSEGGPVAPTPPMSATPSAPPAGFDPAGAGSVVPSGPGTFLPSDLPPRAPRKGRWIAAGVGVVAVAGLGVGAAFAASALRGGGGQQPETFVPSTALAYASVDLDPSLGQKVDALRFLRKFPSAKASLGSTDDLREYIFDQAIKDDPKLSSLSYTKDVKPWIGDRFAVAVVPGASADAEPNAVVVLQVSDAAKAKSGLHKLMTGPDGGTCAIGDGYAVCAETQAILNAAQAATKHQALADNSTFTGDVSAAGNRGIALAWGDIGKLSRLADTAAASDATDSLGLGGASNLSALGASSTGRFVATLRFSGANLQLTGRISGQKATAHHVAGGTGVEQLPTSTQVAIGGSTDAATVAKAYQQFQTSLKASGGAGALDQVQAGLHQLGFRLPQDLSSLLGTKFALAYGGVANGMPQIGLRSNSSEAKAGPVVDRVSHALAGAGAPFQLHHAAAGSGYALALDKAYADQLAGKGGLGDSAAFKAAVPDAAQANVVVYVDLAKLLSGGGLPFGSSGATDPNLKAVSAIGLSATAGQGGASTFRLNVITD